MASTRIAFTLPVPWDRVAQAVERAIEHGEHRFDQIERGNGYWHLRHGGISIHVEMRVHSPASTLVWMTGRHRGLHVPGTRRIDSMLRSLQSEVAIRLGVPPPA